ncbi:MAG: hypothetical protein ACOYOJ_14125 [Alsobacter sp.]
MIQPAMTQPAMTQPASAADLRRAKELLRRSIQSAQDLFVHEASVRRSEVDRQVMLGKIAAAIPDASSRRRDTRQPDAAPRASSRQVDTGLRTKMMLKQ